MNPISLQRIDHAVLRVRELERSIAFYREVLGCEVVKRRDDLGLVHLRVGVSMIDLISIDGALGSKGGAAAGVEGRNVDHIALRIESFDAAAIVSYLRQHDVPTDGQVHDNFGAEGNGPSLYLQDPDGNSIELKGPPRT
ncbi:MAG TPA: VOC family protein [Burkholderiaceae bacterium]|jgi:catechol 2,3-dioxygenase-like lactoylglutathione lyase family enzyme